MNMNMEHVLAPSSSFLTPRCSSPAPANDSWPRHASPVNTGAEHFMTLAYYAQQQWTEAKRHVMAKEHAMAGASEVQGGVRNEDDGA